jgi:predicted alpha/beta-hydrolase family hydrolase
VAIEDAVAPMPVQRMDFPYRKAGRKAPDRPPVLLAAVREEAEALIERAGVAPERLALGGRSMGGRMCSMAVAEGLPAAALVLISYPLHPPGRPETLRTAHLPQLEVPCLFVHGTRDPFGTPDELEAATATIPAPVTHEWIDGGRHDLKGADARVAATVAEWLASLR